MKRRVKYSEKAFEHGVRADNLKYRRLRGTVIGYALNMSDAFRVKWDGRKTIDRLHRDFLAKV